jgi:hypothetical protein
VADARRRRGGDRAPMAHSLSQTNWAESMRCGGGGRGFSFSLPAEMLKASSACGGSQGWHGRMEEEEEEEEEVVVVVGEGVFYFIGLT